MRRRLLIALGLAAALLLWWAAGAWRSPRAPPGFGLVIDSRGAPVPHPFLMTDQYAELRGDLEGRFPIDPAWGEGYRLRAYAPSAGVGTVVVGTRSSALATWAERHDYERLTRVFERLFARRGGQPIRLDPKGAVRLHVLIDGEPARNPVGSFCRMNIGTDDTYPCLAVVPAAADGLIETRGIVAADWRLEASAPEAGEFAELMTRLTGAGVEEFTFNLHRGHRFEGTVVNEHGAPLDCALVRAQNVSYSDRRDGAIRYQRTYTEEVITGADGKFVMVMDPSETVETVKVGREGYAVGSQRLTEDAGATVKLAPLPMYQGTVVDEDEHPVERFTLNGTAFEHGRFAIPTERAEHGMIWVEIDAPGFRKLLAYLDPDDPDHTVVLVRGAVVPGVVRAADGGLADAWVRVTPFGSDWTHVTDGGFELDVDPQELHFPSEVEAWAPGECASTGIENLDEPGRVELQLSAGPCGEPDFTPPDAGRCPWLKRRARTSELP